ncbi:MAG: class I SAM-dependent methyltransferase [Oscillospiraceae bacterium]
MLFPWSGQGIQWFTDASRYTGFHARLAEQIRPYLGSGQTMCGIGCGLGFLDTQLAQDVSHLTCVDSNEAAIQALTQRAHRQGISNITPLCMDVEELNGQFDTLLMSFFGRSGEEFFSYFRLAKKRVIRVVNAGSSGGLYPGKHRRHNRTTITDVENQLQQKGMHYTLLRCKLEFGQPLCSAADAAAYVQTQAPNATPQEIEVFLQQNLQATQSKEFPLYLPNPKDLGVLVVEVAGA